MKSKLKILFVPIGLEGVVFYRMKQFGETINKLKGAECVMYTRGYENGGYGNWESQFGVGELISSELCTLIMKSDVCVMQILHSDKVLSIFALKDRFNKKIMFELDDNIFEVPNFNPAFQSGAYKPGNYNNRVQSYQIKESYGGIVSTQNLKDELIKYNKDIWVIPNSINFDLWDTVNTEQKENKKIRIGWIGGANHALDFEVLRGVVPEIIKKYKNVEFMFVHGIPEWIRTLSKENSQVKISDKYMTTEKYYKHIASYNFDIGIAPLIDCAFNRAKSNLRYLEYSALKIPTVASDVTPYNSTITDLKNGMLASNVNEDWINKLSLLIDNESIRKSMGQKAYDYVKKYYNLKSNSQLYYSILQGIGDNQ